MKVFLKLRKIPGEIRGDLIVCSLGSNVLVQRETESWRAPIASMAPIPTGKFATPSGAGRRKGQRLKLQLVSKGRSGWLVHSPQSALDTGKPTGYEKSTEYTGRQAHR